MSDDAPDFRVVLVAQQHNVIFLPGQLRRNVLRLLHERAGHVLDADTFSPETLYHLDGFTVCADEHPCSVGNVCLTLSYPQPHCFKPGNFLRVVDRKPYCPHFSVILQ